MPAQCVELGRQSFSCLYIVTTFVKCGNALTLIGLRDWRIPASEVVGSEVVAWRHQDPARPGRSQPGQGNLEAWGLLSQCQGGQLSVRHRTECPHPHTSWRRDSLHPQVMQRILNMTVCVLFLVLLLTDLLLLFCLLLVITMILPYRDIQNPLYCAYVRRRTVSQSTQEGTFINLKSGKQHRKKHSSFGPAHAFTADCFLYQKGVKELGILHEADQGLLSGNFHHRFKKRHFLGTNKGWEVQWVWDRCVITSTVSHICSSTHKLEIPHWEILLQS